MDEVAHIITRHFPPAHGGLEIWTLTLANLLATIGIRVSVHVRSSQMTNAEGPSVAPGVSIHHITDKRDFLIAPLIKSCVSERILHKEAFRLDTLLIRSLIGEEVEKGGKHILISNFALFEGFIGHTLSEELGLPHIAILAGTDFSRGIREPSDFDTVSRVLRGAKHIVTKSREQESFVRTALGLENVTTIETSVDDEVLSHDWNYKFQGEIPIFSDSGFDYKKGTHILIEAFRKMRDDGYPVTLSICGDIATGQDSYWNELIDDVTRKYQSHFSYLGYLSQQSALNRLQVAAIYASATIGEGCSKARATALSIGIPTVTTRCGELRFVEKECAGLFLADPCDAGGFTDRLRVACERTMEGTMRSVDKDLFRRRFSRSVELTAWRRMLGCFTD